MSKIYISYSPNDRAIVMPIATNLIEKYGEDRIFVDFDDLLPGDDWDTILNKALEEYAIFLVFISDTSVASDLLNNEWKYALRHRKDILAILLDNSNIPLGLAHVPYLDMTVGDPTQHLGQLYDYIDSVDIPTPTLPPPAPIKKASPSASKTAYKAAPSDTSQAPLPILQINLPSHIYISYSFNDDRTERFLDNIVKQLESQQLKVWVHHENNRYAYRSWQDLAKPHIWEASVILVLVTSDLVSDGMKWEITEAETLGKPIIPVIIKPTALDPILTLYNPINLAQSGNWQPLFDELQALQVETIIRTRSGANNDRVANEDQLEFKHYVSALVDLITSRETTPPLTIGIYGSWGAGKSFLLDHIKRQILEIPSNSLRQANLAKFNILTQLSRLLRVQVNPANIKLQQHPIWARPFLKLVKTLARIARWLSHQLSVGLQKVWQGILSIRTWLGKHLFEIEFAPADAYPSEKIDIKVIEYNAWEYSATDLVWPGLVRKIMTLLEEEVNLTTRLRVRMVRNLKDHVKFLQVWLSIFLIALVLVLSAEFRANFDKQVREAIQVIGIIGLSASFIQIVKTVFANPLATWITQLFEKSDYGKSIGYMEEIRLDLEMLERGLQKRDKRVLVIIDDLDRCEPEKAVEMLQAIKLLLNFDSFIIILGIDARVITKAVERHYKRVLGEAGASGYEYLDKIIQIPFRIPEPTEAEIQKFIEYQMMGIEEREATPLSEIPPLASVESERVSLEEPSKNDTQASSADDTSASPSEAVHTASESIQRRKVIQHQVIAFTPLERNAFKALSAHLRPNPRHIKRMINVYRLVKLLAEYRQEPFIKNNPLTVINWVVLCGQWPYTMHIMLEHYGEMIEDWVEQGRNLAERATIFNTTDSPLHYLYSEVQKTWDIRRRDSLDYDQDLFEWLLRQPDSQITWDTLDKMRQYTLNFNPAVEVQ